MSEGCGNSSPGSVAVRQEARLTLTNRLDELKRLQEFVEAFCQRARLVHDMQHAIDLALTECVTNVISYAFCPDAVETVEVRLSWNGSQVEAEIIDAGRAFDPLKHPSVDISVPLEDKPIGGLGIHLMRRLMDRVSYVREGGKNRLTMTKFVTERPERPA